VRAELQRILELQVDFDARATPAMVERGRLIRRDVADWLASHATPLAGAMRVDDFFSEGRDGTGLKTRVPWVRLGSRVQSPRATEGFYLVYLFDALGDVVYLSLNQGTTDFINGEFVAKSPGVIEARVRWAQTTLADWLPRVGASAEVELHDPRLGAGYERGNVVARAYPSGGIPDDNTLLADVQIFADGLGTLYEARESRPIPNETPEVIEAEEAAAEASGRSRRGSAAGFRTNAAEIRLVERRAIELAWEYYASDGWLVRELGKPFDLEVKRGSEKLDVEVKGTTSDGLAVPLTAGEVRHHEAAFPNNALVVVKDVVLDRGTEPPTASGGVLYEWRHWEIDPVDLSAISYFYEVPRTLYENKGFQSPP